MRWMWNYFALPLKKPSLSKRLSRRNFLATHWIMRIIQSPIIPIVNETNASFDCSIVVSLLSEDINDQWSGGTKRNGHETEDFALSRNYFSMFWRSSGHLHRWTRSVRKRGASFETLKDESVSSGVCSIKFRNSLMKLKKMVIRISKEAKRVAMFFRLVPISSSIFEIVLFNAQNWVQVNHCYYSFKHSKNTFVNMPIAFSQRIYRSNEEWTPCSSINDELFLFAERIQPPPL